MQVRQLLVGLSVALLAAACAPTPPTLPLAHRLQPTLNLVLQDTQLFVNPEVSRTIGTRFIPGLNEWQVIACFSYGEATALQQRCEDGFRVLPMQSGAWVVTLDLQGIHRWRELEPDSKQ